MLMSALYEVCPLSVKEEFLMVMNDLIPNARVAVETVDRSGIQGTRMHVLVDGREEESLEHHAAHAHAAHDHNHVLQHSTHEHHSIMDIHDTIASMNISEAVKQSACSIYDRLAAAEGHAHGREMTEIHFHEVGTCDAILDVVGVCWLMDKLAPERVIASPVRTGYGSVECAHGILPVPAPATAFLLQGIPCYAGAVEGELCTPTGAAVLGEMADEYGSMPNMVIHEVGYGMGKKEFPILNCIRSFYGDLRDVGHAHASAIHPNGSVVELACNIDDMTAEELGYAMEVLRENGALEVYTTVAQMKKNRSGYVFTCLCRPEMEALLAELVMKHTTTIGIRRRTWERYELERTVDTVNTQYGPVRVKRSKGYGVEKQKPEYDDLVRIAREQGCSIDAIRKEIHL